MKILSTNIAKPGFVTINGKTQRTGIHKKPTNKPIYLEKENVKGDEVTNRRVHGGEYKACYLFSADHYPYWEKLYPNLDWHYGMLGENLTVEGLDETQLYVGDVYKVGEALVEITQPREPCTTFAAKMGTPDIMEQFISHGKPGTYTRVIQEGHVAVGDAFELVKRQEKSITITQLFKLLFDRQKNQEHLSIATKHNSLPEKKHKELKRFLK